MRRFVQGFMACIAVVVLVGAVGAVAAGSGADPSDSSSIVGASSPSNDEPGESEAPQTDKPEAKKEDRGSEGGPGSPDFSACDGLTGLDNATCRHTALLKLQPKNTGLANALAHLRTNAERHADRSGPGPVESHAGS